MRFRRRELLCCHVDTVSRECRADRSQLGKIIHRPRQETPSEIIR